MAKEILDGGAPGARSVAVPRWARSVSAALAPPRRAAAPRLRRIGARVRAARTGGGTRWFTFGLAAVVLLGGGALLRAGAGELETPRTVTAGEQGTDAVEWGSPVLPPGAGFALAVQAGDQVVRVEHGRDRTAVVRQPRTVDGVPATLATGGWAAGAHTVLLVPGPRGVGQVAVVLDAAGRVRHRIGPGTRVLPGPHGWSAWLVRAAGGGFTLGRHDLDGRSRGPAETVPAGREPVAVLRDGVVLARPGAPLVLWRPGHDELERLPISGRVVSAAQDLVVVAQDCPGRPACRYWIVNVTGARATRLADTPGQRRLGAPVLSRDGLRLAAMVDPDSADGRAEAALSVATVFDGGARATVVAGTRFRLPGATPLASAVVPPAWSLDGRVFGAVPGAAGLYAYQPGEGGARRLSTPGLGPVTRIVAG